MSASPEETSIVDPFFVRHHLRLHTCPGSLKHPSPSGYASSQLYSLDVVPMLAAEGATRYCWLLDDGHLVIDVDMHEGGANGHAAFERLCADLGVDLLEACGAVVETPTGGRHLYFRIPPEVKVKSLISIDADRYAGLDTISHSIRNNALVIAPGSSHPDVGGTYGWRSGQGTPELVDAPAALVDLIRVPAELERREVEGVDLGPDASPGDRFASTWQGVEHLAKLLFDAGYEFHLTAEDNGAQFYEYRREGKTTAARVSGYIGKLNSNGRYQWTNFSLADPYLESGETVNILEGLRRVLMVQTTGNRGESGVGWNVVMQQLQKWEFTQTAEEAFRDVDVDGVAAVGSEVVEVSYTESGYQRIDGIPDEFWNYENVPSREVDKNGNPKMVKVGRPQTDLLEVWKTVGWPKCVAGTLYALHREGLRPLLRVEDFFAWMDSQTRVVWNAHAMGAISQSRFTSAVTAGVERWDSISPVPMYPRVEGVLYDIVDGIGGAGDGIALAGFVDLFCPATEVDRELIKAAVLTLFWGGPAGGRPAFLVDAEDGTGSGKTTLVYKLSKLIRATPHLVSTKTNSIDEAKIKQMLCQPGSESSRVVLHDNVRGENISSTFWEALITAETIKGDVKYAAARDVPNLYVHFITINGGSLNRDMASRIVQIRLRSPAYDPLWEEKVDDYLRENWGAIVADVEAEFGREPAVLGEKVTRFSRWCREILGRLRDPDAILRALAERGEDMDGDAQKAADLLEVINYYLRQVEVGIPTNVFIPSKLMRMFCEEAWETEFRSLKHVAVLVRSLIAKGSIRYLTKPGRVQVGGVRERGYLLFPSDGPVQNPFPPQLGM